MLGGKQKADPGIDLALVLGGEPKDKSKPSLTSALDAEDGGGEPDGDEAGEGDELPPGFAQAAEEAFDTERPIEERADALHRAFKACSGGGY